MAVQTLGICTVLGVKGAKDINPDAGCCWAMYPDIALGSSPALDNNMDQCGNAGDLGQHGHSCSTAPGHQCGHRLWPRHWASMWTLVAPWATDITKTLAMEDHRPRHGPHEQPRFECHHCLGGGNVSHSGWYHPSCRVSFGPQLNSRRGPLILSIHTTPMVIGTMDPGCGRATNSDIVPGRSSAG